MLKIDNNLLVEIGLGGLPDAEKSSFLKHVYETLEMRVGVRLADQMSNEQLDEFERYFEAKDDAGAFKWLETNFPNYKDIVQEEFDKLKGEVAQTAPQILAASQAAHAAQQPVAAAAAPAPTQAQPVSQPTQVQPVSNQPVQPLANQPIQPSPTPPPYAEPPTQPITPPAQPQYPSEQPPAGPAQTAL